MSHSTAKRVEHRCVQRNPAPPEQVFPLLCPVREADWVPDWRYRMVYSRTGVAEEGCVFATPNDDGSETTWLVTHYDPAACSIAFAWVWPGMVAAQIRIQLEPAAQASTDANIHYAYTSLSPEGNALLERWDAAWFRGKMQSWERAINHYLRHGEKIAAAAWE